MQTPSTSEDIMKEKKWMGKSDRKTGDEEVQEVRRGNKALMSFFICLVKEMGRKVKVSSIRFVPP